MADDVTYTPTGRSSNWAGLDFIQYQVKGGHYKGFRSIYRMHGHEGLTIESTMTGYRAAVDGKWLPTKFRKPETAAKALKGHIEA